MSATARMAVRPDLRQEAHPSAAEKGIWPSQEPRDSRRWSDWDYVLAAGQVALLIAPAPVFWAPPIWVLALMSRPSQATVTGPMQMHARSSTSRACAEAANDNAAPGEDAEYKAALAA
jgi:hypothetical protein